MSHYRKRKTTTSAAGNKMFGSSAGAKRPSQSVPSDKDEESKVKTTEGTLPEISEKAEKGSPRRSSVSAALDQQLQSKISQMDQTKLSLDWFGFETRIRNIVYELLDQPMESVKHMMSHQEQIDESINYAKRRIDEHEFLLYKFQKRTDMEAEYNARICKVEGEVQQSLAKTSSQVSDLTTRVTLTEKKTNSNNDQIIKMNQRLDIYLNRIKDDIDKIAGKNMKLFNDFMGQISEVASKYEDTHLKMQAQHEFFEQNKERYNDMLDKMEELHTYFKTSEQVHDQQLRQLRTEIDRLDTRINEKEKQNSDMLNQVVDLDHKLQGVQREVRDFDKKMGEVRKQVWTVTPALASNLVFDALFEGTSGSQFNKFRDYYETLKPKLQQGFDDNLAKVLKSIEANSHFLADSVELRDVPEKQQEEAPKYSGHHYTQYTASGGGQHSHLSIPRHTAEIKRISGFAPSRKADIQQEDNMTNRSRSRRPSYYGGGIQHPPPATSAFDPKGTSQIPLLSESSAITHDAHDKARSTKPIETLNSHTKSKEPDVDTSGNSTVAAIQKARKMSKLKVQSLGDSGGIQVNEVDGEKSVVAKIDEEQIRDIIGEYRYEWMEEDDERYEGMMQEICFSILEEQLGKLMDENIDVQAKSIEDLKEELKELQDTVVQNEQRSKANQENLQKVMAAEHRNMEAQFVLQKEGILGKFDELTASVKHSQDKFRLNMKEAFENFKVSTELEQTKRMRQIGDFVSTQQRLLGQINFNEKNYQIFQKTSEQICSQVANLLELFKLQNSLNFQEEKDKNSISLFGRPDAEVSQAQKEDKVDKEAKAFMKSSKEGAGLAFKANLLDLGGGKGMEEPKAHLDLDKRCQICMQDANQRHVVMKAMKIACLKYNSSKVKHYGNFYDRMKLIKVQEDLIDQHFLQLSAIIGGKKSMEKSRDIARDGMVRSYAVRLQDFGIQIDRDDPVIIAQKILEGQGSILDLEKSRRGIESKEDSIEEKKQLRPKMIASESRQPSKKPYSAKNDLAGDTHIISHKKDPAHPLFQEKRLTVAQGRNIYQYDQGASTTERLDINSRSLDPSTHSMDKRVIRIGVKGKELNHNLSSQALGEDRSSGVQIGVEKIFAQDSLHSSGAGGKKQPNRITEQDAAELSISSSKDEANVNYKFQSAKTLEDRKKEQFMVLKNKRLTSVDEPEQIGYAIPEVAEQKKQTYGTAANSNEKATGQDKVSSENKLGDFRMPDITRILNNLPESSQPERNSKNNRSFQITEQTQSQLHQTLIPGEQSELDMMRPPTQPDEATLKVNPSLPGSMPSSVPAQSIPASGSLYTVNMQQNVHFSKQGREMSHLQERTKRWLKDTNSNQVYSDYMNNAVPEEVIRVNRKLVQHQEKRAAKTGSQASIDTKSGTLQDLMVVGDSSVIYGQGAREEEESKQQRYHSHHYDFNRQQMLQHGLTMGPAGGAKLKKSNLVSQGTGIERRAGPSAGISIKKRPNTSFSIQSFGTMNERAEMSQQPSLTQVGFKNLERSRGPEPAAGSILSTVARKPESTIREGVAGQGLIALSKKAALQQKMQSPVIRATSATRTQMLKKPRETSLVIGSHQGLAPPQQVQSPPELKPGSHQLVYAKNASQHVISSKELLPTQSEYDGGYTTHMMTSSGGAKLPKGDKQATS